MAAPLQDYRAPFIGSGTVATAIAGLIGTLLAFIAAYLLSRLLVPVLHRGGAGASGTGVTAGSETRTTGK